MIEIRNVTKRYGGTHALRGVSFDLQPGTVHALCGENGAGKSTLNRILAGLVAPDEGTITLDGVELRSASVHQAEAAGISMVHQESAAFLHLTAVENHQIMHEPGSALWLDRAEMRQRTQASLDELGERIDLDVPASSLSNAQRQMISIARALSANSKLLILDEPTAMLSVKEAEAIARAVRMLRDRGTCVLYVSHRLDEVFALADRVTVLRDGTHIGTLDVADVDRAELVRMMAGDTEVQRQERSTTPGEPALTVRGLTREGVFSDIDLKVGKGEIVVLAGLVGAGRSEVARAVVGLDPVDKGDVVSGGRTVLVPEDRQHEGLHLALPIRDNLAMAQLAPAIIDRKREARQATALVDQLSIKTANDLNPVSSLSGGNQQKVLVGKWLATEPDVLILDEPTRGVDVVAKAQIHEVVRSLASKGKAILVISSDMAEVLELGDRIIVMREGRIASKLTQADATQERVLELALPSEQAQVASYEAQARRSWPREAGVAGLLLATMAAATISNPTFLTGSNILDMLVKVAPAIIVGVMMTLVILAREIDISVGSLMGLCAAVLGVTSSSDRLHLPPVVSMAIVLGVGLVGGLMNGLLVAKAKVPSIIVTLGMLTVFRGITEQLMAGKWIENLPPAIRELGTGKLLGVPHAVSMALVAVGLGLWITKRTRFGLQVYAVGSSPEAATMRGVPSDRVRIALFALTGLAAAIATLFSASQLQVIESGFGAGFELVVIAAVVVGGTSIRGGEGSILGTLLGATLLGTISTVLIFLRLGDSVTYWERAIQGLLILLAVVGDHFWRARRCRS